MRRNDSGNLQCMTCLPWHLFTNGHRAAIFSNLDCGRKVSRYAGTAMSSMVAAPNIQLVHRAPLTDPKTPESSPTTDQQHSRPKANSPLTAQTTVFKTPQTFSPPWLKTTVFSLLMALSDLEFHPSKLLCIPYRDVNSHSFLRVSESRASYGTLSQKHHFLLFYHDSPKRYFWVHLLTRVLFARTTKYI